MWEFDQIVRIPTDEGDKYIFVGVENYSKWVVAKLISNKDSKTIADCIDSLILKNLKSKIQLTDNGLEFVGTKVREFLIKCGIEQKLASPYHNKTTGLVERTNQTL
jgi:hypothetical protein